MGELDDFFRLRAEAWRISAELERTLAPSRLALVSMNQQLGWLSEWSARNNAVFQQMMARQVDTVARVLDAVNAAGYKSIFDQIERTNPFRFWQESVGVHLEEVWRTVASAEGQVTDAEVREFVEASLNVPERQRPDEPMSLDALRRVALLAIFVGLLVVAGKMKPDEGKVLIELLVAVLGLKAVSDRRE